VNLGVEMKSRIDVPCPECGRTMRPTLIDVKLERTVTCPAGHRVTLRDSGGGVRKADRMMGDFAKNLNRTIKIRS